VVLQGVEFLARARAMSGEQTLAAFLLLQHDHDANPPVSFFRLRP